MTNYLAACMSPTVLCDTARLLTYNTPESYRAHCEKCGLESDEAQAASLRLKWPL